MDLNARMKLYESCADTILPPRMPIFIRCDGKRFSKFTKKSGFKKPWDESFIQAMDTAALALFREVQSARYGYVQSDEITIMSTPYETFETQPWLGGRIQKICSIAASCVTMEFNRCVSNQTAMFDARAFVVPREDAGNVFVWRQKDCIRNSVQMLAHHTLGKKNCHGKACRVLRGELAGIGTIWDDLPTGVRLGRIILKNAEGKIEVSPAYDFVQVPGLLWNQIGE